MKKKRFNSKVGRSAGLGAFMSSNDFYDLATTYRTWRDSKHNDLIDASMNASETLYATFGSRYYDEELMIEFYAKLAVKHKTVPSWINDYCSEEITYWNNYTVQGTQRIFRDKEEFYKYYIPVYWDAKDLPKDIGFYAQRLMEKSGIVTMPMYNYAMRILKDGRKILYARIAWLRTFSVGCDLLNYYTMASQRNFKKVYRF